MKSNPQKLNRHDTLIARVYGTAGRLAVFVLLIMSAGLMSATAGKPRVINTTDLGADVDDRESLVRMLVTANEVDLEGIIGVSSCWYRNQTWNNVTNLLNPILNAYGQVLPNLQVHAGGYPSLAYLQSITKLGQPGFGMAAVGAGKDSDGSDMIITAVDKDDPRPVWVNLWGGANTVAQALWKVQNTRTPAQVAQFVSKLRVYDVLGQDDAGAWIAKNFPNLVYIRFLGVYSWQPSDSWLVTNIQSQGPLGAVYPTRIYATEGDTPAFLYEYPNGLSDPEHIDWGSWGGRCSLTPKAGVRGMSGGNFGTLEAAYDPYYMYSDAPEGGASISRWSTAINNDFAARMDWSITNSYAGANHHPVAALNGDTNKNILQISAAPGSSVGLSAVGSSDPDGNALTYSWSFYSEPSSYSGTVNIQNSTTPNATVTIPSNATNKTIHVVLEVHDNGTPNLYAYRRAVITMTPPATPDGLMATTVSSNQLNLAWNAASDANSYNIKRSTTNGGPYTVIATDVTATTFSDTGLTPSTTYYYVVSAAGGLESGDSAPASAQTGSALRLRVVISTDFPPTNVCMPNNGCPSSQTSDPDDVQSMVRWLLYVNEFDVEGMVASSGTFAGIANKTNILNMLDLYDQVRPNLLQHDLRYPNSAALRAVTYQGRSGTWGGTVANNIGAGKDSEASSNIIAIVDKPDPRPVWFCFWGDCSPLAQAIWSVQNTRTAAELTNFLSKIRIHQIAHQDDTIDWMMTNFPSLFIIYSKTTYQGMFNSDNAAWVATNIIQNHGPLGAVYPPRGIGSDGVCEGDTPSFLHLVSALRGLNNPEDPTTNSWGGRFNRNGTTSHYVDGSGAGYGGSSISMWKSQYEAEFQQRANWMISNGTNAVGAPVIGLAPAGLTNQVVQGLNAGSMTLTVSNAGAGTLNYSLMSGSSWLAAAPTTGSSTGQSVSHMVSFVTSNLPPGSYSSWITISNTSASQSVVNVPVTVQVLNSAPTIGVSPAYLATTSLQGRNAQSASLNVFNGGTGVLNYSLSNGAPWLAVTATSGSSTGPANPISHTVSFITSNLPPGAYTSWVSITAPSAAQPLAYVPVAVRVMNAAGATNSSSVTPLIAYDFNEGSGTTATNSGSLGGTGNFTVNNGYPVFASTVITGPFAPLNSSGSVDFGPYLSSITGQSAIERSGNLGRAFTNGFTVSGWLNCRTWTIGYGGNRIVACLDGNNGRGFDLVQSDNGSLRCGINQWSDGSNPTPPLTANGVLPLSATADPTNWVFIAVTFNPSLASGNLSYFIGKSDTAAMLLTNFNYKGNNTYANVGITNAGPLSVGCGNTLMTQVRGTSGSNIKIFRGLMDNIAVYDRALSADEIQSVQVGAPPADPEIHMDSLNSSQLLLSWIGANVTLEKAPDVSGPWVTHTNQAGAQFIEPTENRQFFRLR